MTHNEAMSSLASERYLLDEMTEVERDAFEAHYFECLECADDVRSGAILRDGVRAGLVPSHQTARIAAFPPVAERIAGHLPGLVRQPWYRSPIVPWAIAATLAVMVGYQSRSSTPGAHAGGSAQALITVTLRPASRGAVPTVSLAAAHAALALDLDAGGSARISYELRSSDNSVVTSGQTSAPPPGSPLVLVIPTFTLKPQQRYILTVHDADAPERLLGDFPFATAS